MAVEKWASLNPDDFGEGGGLLDNVNVTFKEVRFVMWDYNGKVPTPSPALHVRFEQEDGSIADQYWSAGQGKDFIASKDGSRLIPLTDGKTVVKTSNAAMLIKSIVDSGFPKDKLVEAEGKCTVFEGMKAHVFRKPTSREGIKKDEGKKYEDTVLLVSEIIQLPWEKGKGSGGGKSGGGGKAATSDINEKAQSVMFSIVSEKGSIAKKDLPMAIFNWFKDNAKGDPDQGAVTKLAVNDEFLGSGPWAYVDGVLSLG